MSGIINKVIQRYYPSELQGVDRDSVQYFEILMGRVRKRGTYVNRLYRRYYRNFLDCLSKYKVDDGGVYLELGSGYGFFKDYCAGEIQLIRTDVVPHQNLDQIVNGEKLPFDENSVSAIFLFGVLHHIKHVESFFSEAERCLRPGGAVIMIEPTGNKFAQFMYRVSHSEPFDAEVTSWVIPGSDPMTCANLALPHVIFNRDLGVFQERFKKLKIRCNEYHSPLLFQMSGAGAYEPPLGNWSYYLFLFFDWVLTPFHKQVGMFSTIVLQKDMRQ